MAARPSELTNFFWHCRVAVKLIDELPDTTVTRSHAARAVRMATLCAAGRDGVEFASTAAMAVKQGAGNRKWWECQLHREHVIPVANVHKYVLQDLRASCGSGQSRNSLVESDKDNDMQWLPPAIIALFRDNPRAWQAARIIRYWTELCWVTPGEHEEFGRRKLGDRMPKDWRPGMDRFARYKHCKIDVVPIPHGLLTPLDSGTHASMTPGRVGRALCRSSLSALDAQISPRAAIETASPVVTTK